MKNISSKLNILLDSAFILLGTYLISLATNMFLLPYKMTTGGISGISTIIYYLFNIPMGISMIVLNLPLFIFSMYKFGIKFSFKTIFATVLLSVFLDLFKYEEIIKKTSIDLFNSCVFGGLITGFGISLVFKAGASTGGSDLLAQIIYKYIKVEKISNVLFLIEIMIISSIVIVFKNINVGLYSLIAVFISNKVIDILFTGIDYVKIVTIITRKSDGVIDAILNDLKRGATVTNSIGAHSGDEITTITCIITRPQIGKIKNIIRDNDSDAIMYITTANDAIGKGFREYK